MFIIGQRWVSDNEPELGLGVVESVNKFNVTINFYHRKKKEYFLVKAIL